MKQLSSLTKKYPLLLLLLISASTLISSCSGTHNLAGGHNAPHSLFTSSVKHKSQKITPQESSVSEKPASLPEANSFSKAPLPEMQSVSPALSQPITSAQSLTGKQQVYPDIKYDRKKDKLEKRLLRKETLITKSQALEPVPGPEKENKSKFSIPGMGGGHHIVLIILLILALAFIIAFILLILLFVAAFGNGQ